VKFHVVCEYCGEKAKLVNGKALYPHSPALWKKWFYKCDPCEAWVGCHPDTRKPLGRLAKADLRRLKMIAHNVFDAIWKRRFERKHAIDPKYSRGMARGGRYSALAKELGIPKERCHIGEFDNQMCARVIAICKSGVLEKD